MLITISAVYSNLAIAFRTWMRSIESQNKSDLRIKLMQIYDFIPKHLAFKNLNISDFTFVNKAKKRPAVNIDY